VNIGGKEIVSYNMHLESKGDAALRVSQLSEALSDARRYDGNTPIVFAGDFNLDVSSGPAAVAIRQAQFQDAFANRHTRTTPGSFLEPGRTIDWIFTRGSVHAMQAQVHRSVVASDHFPLSVTLTLP
jgi:endonuclease/exonuclease/phosphatase (EEP) superfamily protein YafD